MISFHSYIKNCFCNSTSVYLNFCISYAHGAVLHYIYFRFPIEPERKKNWLAKMHRNDWNPNKYSLICSDHFLEKDIDMTSQNVHLRANAIPVRFKKFPSHLKKVYQVLWWKHKYKTPFEHDGINHDENNALMYLVWWVVL